MLRTILLLIGSNIFMTFAWYYHLQQKGWSVGKAIVLSWLLAFFEYSLQVPANKYGYAHGISAFQLKIIQEVITLVIFTAFAILVLKESFRWNYVISFAFILGAVYFAFKK